MPPLTRRANPLLRTVKHKQHATAADHHEDVELPTPPPSSWKDMANAQSSGQTVTQELEDYTQDPLSSDDEAMQPETTQEETRSHLAMLNSSRTGSAGRGSRAAQDNASSSPEDDDDGPIFGVRQPSNSRLNGFSSQSAPATFKKPPKRLTYSSQKDRPRKKARTDPVFKQPQIPAATTPRKRSAVFKSVREASIFKNIDDDDLLSSQTSPLSSAPASSQDVSFVGETTAARCDICQEEVDILLKQEFQDRYGDENGKLNFPRQKAFCRHHQQHEGRKVWQERGYPTIEWSDLDRRMNRNHDRLRYIIQRKQKSVFFDKFAEDIEARKTQTNKKLWTAEEDLGSSAGYYGPKGQQAMVKNITAHLAEDLKEAALTDPVLGTKGIQGGITGFVQSVLIPEMAVLLIMDDLDLDEAQARILLAESRDLGEKVNPEEKNTERVEDDELEDKI